MLKERQEKTGSLLCVGLDPLAEKMQVKGLSFTEAETARMEIEIVIGETAPYACMFKPQRAHWEAIPGGEKALRAVINYIKTDYPDIPVFLDCKRGDIGRTQARYREAHFGLDGVDGMNFSPYMGMDCMSALVDKEKYPGRAIVGLCYTSNPAAREVQDIGLIDGRRYWEFIAETTLGWAKDLGVLENAGLVMAAAYESPKGSENVYSKHLTRCREIVGDDLWFLIPGVGTQGGYVEETVKAAWTGYGSIAINSSSGIIFADDPAEEARKLRDQIQNAIPE